MTQTLPNFTPLLVYQMYNSIKTHYNNPSYEFSKYGLNAGTFNQKTFDARPDKYKFEKLHNVLSQRENSHALLKNLLSSFFFYKPTAWIGDINDNIDYALGLARQRVAFNSNVPYNFKSDIDKVFIALELSPTGNFGDYINSSGVVDGEAVFRIPKVIDMVAINTIQPETALLLDSIYGYINKIDAKQGRNKVWQSVSQRFKKFRSFMNISDKDYQAVTDYLRRKLLEVGKDSE